MKYLDGMREHNEGQVRTKVGPTMRLIKNILKILAALVVVLTIAVFLIFQLPEFGGRYSGKRLERMQRSPEFIAGRFQDVPPQNTDPSWSKTRKLYGQGQLRKPQFEIPVIKLDPRTLDLPASKGLKTIWFGHSSVLLEIEGVRIMTDPVLSDVVSPVPSPLRNQTNASTTDRT